MSSNDLKKKFRDDAKEFANDSKEMASRIAAKTKEISSGGLQKILSSEKIAEKKKTKKIFGVPLDPHSTDVPHVLAKVLEYFQVKGLRYEGLFRLSGSQVATQELKNRFDNGENVDLLMVNDVHTVAGLLKLWFRELPEPLLTYELYDCFLAAAAITSSEASRHSAKSALRALPACHYLTVKHLMAFLDLVQRDAEVNKMTPSNLALVFAPNLLRPAPTHTDEDAILMLADTPMANRLLEMFVIHYEEIFEESRHVPAYAVPVSEPQKKIDFVWRTSRPPSAHSPLAGIDPSVFAPAASATPPPLPTSPPPPTPPPSSSSTSSPSTSSSSSLIAPPSRVPLTLSASAVASPHSSPGIMQSIYFGSPPDLSAQNVNPPSPSPISPPRDKKSPKPQPAPVPKKPTPTSTATPPPLPSAAARPALSRTSSPGVALNPTIAPSPPSPTPAPTSPSPSISPLPSLSSSSPNAPMNPPRASTPTAIQKSVHRRSRSSDEPPALPPRSPAAQSYSSSARFASYNAATAQSGGSSIVPPSNRASVKQLKQSFEA